MDIDTEEDYSTLSNKDLTDLKDLTKKALDHYDSILSNQDILKKEAGSFKMEIELCKKYTLEDYEKIQKEYEKRELDIKK
jgi:hypothetical protein